MKARVVIGANFGDEGKGLITDYLCAKYGAGMVVRFNGGSQAGHTVVTPEGKRHVFKHFGSGTFLNIPTFLSQFFILNPIMFFKELDEINLLGFKPIVYAHPNCLVTTFADMIINQRIENARGHLRHGSVGLGIGETIERSNIESLKITMSDLWNGRNLKDKLREICTKYAEFRTGSIIAKYEPMIDNYIKGCEKFAEYIFPLGIDQCKEPIFEGAQGLLLDQNNAEFFPHVTRSNTGMKNVRVLCEQAGIKDIDIYYVSRTYLTRHGAGPLPGEDPSLTSFHDDTNVPHDYQGVMRFAPINLLDLYARCATDANKNEWNIAITHFDQLEISTSCDIKSYGPTRKDVELV